MRTTLNIDDELIKEAKIEAVRRGTTLTALVETGLRRELRHVAAAEPIVLPTAAKGSRPRSGIDFSRSSALLDLLDEGEYTHADP